MATHPKIMSLCTGYGGLEMGIRLVEPGARTVCMVEREAFACANMVAKIEAGAVDDCPVWSNLETFDGTSWSGKVDIITAGIPCQPWSVAGKQQGVEDDRWIWQDIYRIVREVRPSWFFVEEVPGFIRGGLGLVIRDLAEIGYVGCYDFFSVSDMEGSQPRQRIFMLARMGEYSCQRCEWSIRPTGGDRRQEETVEGTGCNEYWPSRPNAQQYPLEPARTIRTQLKVERDVSGCTYPLDRCICVPENRTDELRLLGNGVSPIAAAFAFTVLRERMNDE